jgi:hypothetical protein
MAISTAASTAWRWSDHWNPHPPDGWNGQHELSARGYGTNFETAGVILSCSCGREARASEDDDDGGAIVLTALNELAAVHIREAGQRNLPVDRNMPLLAAPENVSGT